MLTNINKIYLDLIKQLAERFAERRASDFSERYAKKVFNSTYEVYYNISIYLYIRLNKISRNKTSFNFNRISSYTLKKFSCKLYKHVLEDLAMNRVIVINNHYSNDKEKFFSKSFLIHRDVLRKIDDAKYRFKHKIEQIEIPSKVMTIGSFTSTSDKDDSLLFLQKLNTYYRTNNQERKINTTNFYKELEYSEKDLDDYCNDDEFMYNHYRKELSRLKLVPTFTKGRWYHAFHGFPKKFRESVLKFEGENIKEIFDIHGSDLHMLAKILENEDIPTLELINFQEAVKSDFRKLFGIRKNGKCTERVKTAFKVFLNTKYKKYTTFRQGSICYKIDEYFDIKFPTIREYIRNNNKIWLSTMNEEFNIVSKKMVKALFERGIKSFSCHDALYVKSSINVPDIENIFYDKLDLKVDLMNKLYDI